MEISEKTREQAQALYDYLIMNPEYHDQGNWVKNGEDSGQTYVAMQNKNMCGTTMCAAGTVVYLNEGFEGVASLIYFGGWAKKAAKYLDIDRTTADRIFYNMNNETALDQILTLANGDWDKFMSIKTRLEEG